MKEFNTFEQFKKGIKDCKNKEELDKMRLPLIESVPKGLPVDDFYKLQKLFRTQKSKLQRNHMYE